MIALFAHPKTNLGKYCCVFHTHVHNPILYHIANPPTFAGEKRKFEECSEFRVQSLIGYTLNPKLRTLNPEP